MKETLQIVSFAIGVFCYAIKELQSQNKLRWQDEYGGFFAFWGRNSWVRKYKRVKGESAAIFKNIKNPNLYYRFFKIKYQEAYPWSATALVWTTDGYHLMQWVYIKLFVISIVLYTPIFNAWYWDAGLYLVIWYIVFNATYKVFSK